MRITYELIRHTWWLCVDQKPMAQLRGPYELELTQRAVKELTALASKITVETMLRLLEDEHPTGTDGLALLPDIEATELDNYITVVQR